MDEAERWAREGMARQPKDANLHNVLGLSLKNKGRLEDAEPC